MLKKTVICKQGIMIVDDTRFYKYTRTCDICGKEITGTFYRLYRKTLENPKIEFCSDICNSCKCAGKHINEWPMEKYSAWAIKKFLNPAEEINIDPEYDYEDCNWFNDDPETEDVNGENNKAVTDFIDFVRKTAKSLGILEERGRIRYGH